MPKQCFNCYCEYGLASTGVKTLGTACGISSPMLLSHFGTNEDKKNNNGFLVCGTVAFRFACIISADLRRQRWFIKGTFLNRF